MKPPQILPSVHLNGTSRDALVEQRLTILRALHAARDTFSEYPPHPRDYYVQSDHAWQQAMMIHRDRQSRLDALIEEFETEAEAIANENTP